MRWLYLAGENEFTFANSSPDNELSGKLNLQFRN